MFFKQNTFSKFYQISSYFKALFLEKQNLQLVASAPIDLRVGDTF